MKTLTGLFCVIAVLCFATTVVAEDLAATSEAPAALQALGAVEIVSVDEAEAVRGQCYNLPDFWQDKDFTIGATSGYATGTISLFEGVIATFEYNKLATVVGEDGSSEMLALNVSGNIGGLTGTIGVGQDALSPTFGELSWFTAGKSLSETTEFTGDSTQNFAQHFEAPIITLPTW